jgi:Icc protein
MTPEQSSHKQAGAIKFIHITDTHLLDAPEETFHRLNTKENLERVLSESLRQYSDIDFILFTGDISQTGTVESYALFKSVLQGYELPVYCVPGNHDTPKLLQHVIPDAPDRSINVIALGGFSLILLNSWVDDAHHGRVAKRCLRQLEAYLKNSGDQFNIIAIHHPPVLINSKWLDELGLKNQSEFLQVIQKHSENTLLVCGHVHQEIDQLIDGLRLFATPSTCHQYEANSEHMSRIAAAAPAYRYVALSINNGIDTKVHYI